MVKSNWYIKLIPIIVVTIICLLFLPFVLGSEEVSIENVKLMEESTINDSNVGIGIDGLTLNLNAKFNEVGDYAKFEVTINNPTTEEYELKVGHPGESEYIKYENDLYDVILKGNSTKTFYITLTYENEVPASMLNGKEYSEDNTFNIILSNDIYVEENVTNVIEENTSNVIDNAIENNEINETNETNEINDTETNTIEEVNDNKDDLNKEKETIIDKIINKSNNPKTGDNILIYLMASVTAIGLTAVFVYYPSRKIYLGATIVTVLLIIIIPLTSFASLSKEVIINTKVQIEPIVENKTIVKYAVQIYGINQDENEDGKQIGLTFGPATGANYNNSYVTHEYEKNDDGETYKVVIVTHEILPDGSETLTRDYLRDNEGNLVLRFPDQKDKYDLNMHNMTWDEIKNTSSDYFYDCMLCGDTKSVTLYLNDTISKEKTYTQRGDGAGVLFETIKEYYRGWNPCQNTHSVVYNAAATNGGSNGSNGKDAEGYSSSHIRATLLGENNKTDITYAGDKNLDKENCLYSCIEEDLKNVITPKKVKYVTGTTSNYNLKEDITDEIWLFSNKEMNSKGLGACYLTEGASYSKFSDSNSKYYLDSNSNEIKRKRLGYTEAGRSNWWWLRTPNLYYSSYAQYIDAEERLDYTPDVHLYDIGISFGFCIDSIVDQ